MSSGWSVRRTATIRKWRLVPATVMLIAFLDAGCCFGQSGSELRHCLDLFQAYQKAVETELKVPRASEVPEERIAVWRKERADAWQKVVETGRQYLGGCPKDPGGFQTNVLRLISEGLRVQGHGDEALPIVQRCLSIDPDETGCWLELGNVEEEFPFCHYDDARDAFTKVIQIGGFTEVNAQAVEIAKWELDLLDDTSTHPTGCPPKTEKNNTTPADTQEHKRFGSGFFVTKQGHILTSNHVVEGCKSLATRDGKPLTLVYRNTKSDLALLKATMPPETVAVFRSGPSPKPGDAVIAFGFPLPTLLSAEGNVSTGVLAATAGLRNDVRFVQISAAVQPGNSGGPLLDGSGHVIGVVEGKLDVLAIARFTGDVPQNVNFAVHWADVRAFLDSEGIPYLKGPSLATTRNRDIATSARQFTVAIDCIGSDSANEHR